MTETLQEDALTGAGPAPPVAAMLDDALSLLLQARTHSARESLRSSRLVQEHPGDELPSLVAFLLRRTRHQVLYLHGAAPAGDPSGDPSPAGDVLPAVLRCWYDAVTDPVSGRSVRLLCHPDTARMRWPVLLGGAGRVDARVSPACLGSGAVFDDRAAIIIGYDPAGSASCLLVRSPELVRGWAQVTRALWDAAPPLTDIERYCDSALDEAVTVRVVRLLAAGSTDDASARCLGVSVRTYRRYVAETLRRLGATSRFQAGVRAAAMGLVSDGDTDRRCASPTRGRRQRW